MKAFLGNHLSGFRTGFCIAIDANDVGALPGEQRGNRLAVAPAGRTRSAACNKRDLVCKIKR